MKIAYSKAISIKKKKKKKNVFFLPKRFQILSIRIHVLTPPDPDHELDPHFQKKTHLFRENFIIKI